jgi:hypothetical protein
MTAQQPQREYIITDMQVKRIMVLMNRDTCMDEDEFMDIAKELRARPHTPAPECSKMPLPVCDTCELEWTQCGLDSIECHRTMIEHIKIEAARTATLAALVELLDVSHGVWNIPDLQDRIRDKIKSLRTTAAQEDKQKASLHDIAEQDGENSAKNRIKDVIEELEGMISIMEQYLDKTKDEPRTTLTIGDENRLFAWRTAVKYLRDGTPTRKLRAEQEHP